ncbi:MAG: 3'(2'),5'-bisphosphate nucleotidase [Planctomycetota bacterium]|nr:MAG: 3'(2'),5'-bisphosphate nucleotidase [Planctomycetota bacterium]
MASDTARLAARAVAQACAVCRRVQADIERVRAVTKDDRSPVTVADFASQAVIAHRLAQADPDLALVGEETSEALRGSASLLAEVLSAVRPVWPDADEPAVLEALDLASHPGGEGSFWTLDPIDGTKGFLRGQQYAVSLARLEAGAPTLAFLGCPNLPAQADAPLDVADGRGVIYAAAAGEGAFIVTDDGVAQGRIVCATWSPGAPVRLCESVEKAHSSQSASARIAQRVGGAGEPARLDSQCKYAVVARGQADAYLRMPTKPGYVERIWDHAAGALVATEAGCRVTDVRGRALDFGLGRGLEANLGVVCAAPALHGTVIDAIAALGLDRPPAG